MERTSAWSTVGKEYRTKSLQDAFKAYDLDYHVTMHPLYAHLEDGTAIEVPNKMVTVREDTNRVFGIVSDKYPIIQNQEALSFMEGIISDSGMELVRGGSTSWGSYYMIGELPPVTILGDSVKPHLIFQSSHDGSVPLRATVCMLRIVCQNQFAHSFAESPATIRVTHRGDTESKLKAAADTLHSLHEYIKTYDHHAERLASVKVTPTKFNEIVETFFKIPDGASKRVETRINDQKMAFRDAYGAIDNSNLKGNLWGVINAYTDYATHRTVKNQETLFLDSINPTGSVSNFVNFVDSAH